MTRSCVVVVPVYRTALEHSELYALTNNLNILANWPIAFIGPHKLRPFIEDELAPPLAVERSEFFDDTFFESLSGYNRLLLTKTFYERFSDHEYVLIAQTDALVFSDKLHYWTELGFSYVGAPWIRSGGSPSEHLSFFGVGNGGLSLRRVGDFLRVLNSLRYIPNIYHRRTSLVEDALRFIKHRLVFAYSAAPFQPRINEDAFWGLLVPRRCDFFKVPDPLTAAAFCFEAAPRQLFDLIGGVLPFGCHAWEKYDREFWIELGLVEAAVLRSD